jgi:hypothetical protein
MLAPGPWVDWDCIVKILTAESIDVLEYDAWPDFAFAIPKGDTRWPWPIRKHGRLAGPEVESLFRAVGLDMKNLATLQAQHCNGRATPNPPILN